MKVGKTTLMVKYVENKFDEDYIQTLGMAFADFPLQMCRLSVLQHVFCARCKFYGKDCFFAQYRNHFQHMGSGRTEGVLEYVASRLQRRSRYFLHV